MVLDAEREEVAEDLPRDRDLAPRAVAAADPFGRVSDLPWVKVSELGPELLVRAGFRVGERLDELPDLPVGFRTEHGRVWRVAERLVASYFFRFFFRF